MDHFYCAFCNCICLSRRYHRAPPYFWTHVGRVIQQSTDLLAGNEFLFIQNFLHHTSPSGIRSTVCRGSYLMNEKGWRFNEPSHHGWPILTVFIEWASLVDICGFKTKQAHQLRGQICQFDSGTGKCGVFSNNQWYPLHSPILPLLHSVFSVNLAWKKELNLMLKVIKTSSQVAVGLS